MTTFLLVRTESDIQTLASLASEIWHEYFPCIISNEQIDYMIDRFQSVHALTEQLQTGYCYQMLLYDDMPIGYFGICPQADGSLFLSKLYIKQAFRGKGFASLQFQEILRQARKRRASSVWLTVNKHNEQAIAVYRHFGMTCIRSQVSEIGNGFVMDDYVFSIPVALGSAIS